MRDARPYGERREWIAPQGYGIGLDPVSGCYKHKLRSGSVIVGIRIFFGPPLDPVTGEELDRSLRFQAHCNGEYIDLDDVWPACAGEPISEELYLRYCRRLAWARQHAPKSAYAEPGRKIDLLSTDNPLPF